MTETTTNPSQEPCAYTQFACIGTGFSGIGLGATLKRWYNISDIQFFERNSSLGGTWLANRYPGCACDVPTALYSYSYESNPDWTRVLPPAEELWEYLNGVAGKYDLHRHMTFGVEVRRAQWIETKARWRLTIVRLENDTEFHHECQFLFGATGQIVRPRELDVPGVETFKGPVFHSSQWRQDVDLTGKKVVVFGNGCTGAQLVATIVRSTKHLTHVARAKHWFLPGMDAYIDDYTRAFLRVPGVSALSRFLVFIFAEEQLRAFYQNWDSKRYRRNMGEKAEKYMRKTAPEKYHDMLIPDFEVGCKRRIFDPGYLKALHAENLELTNESVQEIVPEGVKMAGGRLIEADVIVACNGFQMQNFLSPIEVIGVGGETAEQHWAKMGGGPEAYNCVAMSGFPNFFAILGPNTLTGHTSAVIASENSVNYALRIIKPLLDGKGTIAEVSPEAERKYVNQVQDALSKTVLATGCGSWYVTKLDDGREWNGTVYPWTQGHYWYRCLFPVWKDWHFRGPTQKQRKWVLGRLVLSLGLMGALAGLFLSTRLGSDKLKLISAYLSRYRRVMREYLATLKLK
ncbi:hypothetical protein N0V82_001297 [Gnomoniopsis sp. IMI 355080]|nr:hypothetical protein N0V82_001297 [Gnomoniopsis sp. IMI 355080]